MNGRLHLLKDISLLAIALFLSATPFLTYYYSHGPACPCHALVKR